MVLFDAIVNNTDRKFGHILLDGDQLLGCDHGVTFHMEDKLRTVLWQFTGEALTESDNLIIEKALGMQTALIEQLLTPDEVEANFLRTERLKVEGAYPAPSEDWPAVPWPPF